MSTSQRHSARDNTHSMEDEEERTVTDNCRTKQSSEIDMRVCKKSDKHKDDQISSLKIAQALQVLLREIRRRTECMKESDLDRMLTNGELLMKQLAGTQNHQSCRTVSTDQQSKEKYDRGETQISEVIQPVHAKRRSQTQNLQLALNSTREDLAALQCQYQDIVLQLCSKNTEITRMKHTQQQQLAELRLENVSLTAQVNELMQENSRLRYTQQQLTHEVQRTNATVQRMDEYLRKLLNGLEVPRSAYVESPHSQPRRHNETSHSGVEHENQTSTQLLTRVVQLLETVVAGGVQKQEEPLKPNQERRQETPVNTLQHNTHFGSQLEDAMTRFTAPETSRAPSSLFGSTLESQKLLQAPEPTDSMVNWLAGNSETPAVAGNLVSKFDVGAMSEFSFSMASSSTISTMRSVEEREFADGLANLDSQILRLQQVIQFSS